MNPLVLDRRLESVVVQCLLGSLGAEYAHGKGTSVRWRTQQFGRLSAVAPRRPPALVVNCGPMSAMRQICAAASGLCGFGLMSSAIASPPPLVDTTFTHRVHASPAARLDLQLLVEHSAPPISHGATTGFASTAFPSAIHHLDVGKADLGTDDRYEQRAALGVGGTNFRTMGQAEILALRIRREGLPFARLLESKSALLSIGLNQRGKPGLWVTQKVH